ncbi:formate/nitrite transporter family protein [Shimia sp. R10_1]|uniref:formate/nitrite transporter family protein n=1 Tax=Shimia sp. R10_1 TaxID=2821095 RepID=UPI001ADA8C86|nr:formate/nitrite transporter family protein [Shimia sp. R10_1]MBO9473337.1 formate/nitrite transporter family protein [Shimia sp. R10_1]
MSRMIPTPNAGYDAHKPAEITRLVRLSGVTKAEMPLLPLITLSILGGAFISFGALFYTQTTSGFVDINGALKLMGGIAFSLGLILVVIGGAELFTGNTMIVMAYVDRHISTVALMRNWTVVLIGNALGCVAVLALVQGAGLLDGSHGARAAAIAEAKSSLTPLEAFCRGILCNALVCLAVWLAVSARSTLGMILSIIWPVSAFVAIGLEHSIANMYLIPAGALSGADISLAALMHNIVPVLLGNIIGGAGIVALAYRLAYGRNLAEEQAVAAE